MAARSPHPRKNRVRCGAPVNMGVIVLDGNGGTVPAISVGGDRCGLVDRTRGTNGVTDAGTGQYTIHLREKYSQLYIVDARITVGSGQSLTSVEWDSTNHNLDVVVDADTSDEVQITLLGHINRENDG